MYAGAFALAGALLALAPRLGSPAIALGAGLASGGALATLVCGLGWHDGVPNPLLRGAVAFNLADLAIAVGVALLLVGALLHGWRNRAHLHEPI